MRETCTGWASQTAARAMDALVRGVLAPARASGPCAAAQRAEQPVRCCQRRRRRRGCAAARARAAPQRQEQQARCRALSRRPGAMPSPHRHRSSRARPPTRSACCSPQSSRRSTQSRSCRCWCVRARQLRRIARAARREHAIRLCAALTRCLAPGGLRRRFLRHRRVRAEDAGRLRPLRVPRHRLAEPVQRRLGAPPSRDRAPCRPGTRRALSRASPVFYVQC